MIQNFSDFTAELLRAGFSVGGSNSEGIFSLCSTFGDQIAWHTGNPETDPWEWRMRVLDERDDIAYAKVFFNKSGFITKAWYPCFLACRRPNGRTFFEEYQSGTLSQNTKRIYDILNDNECVPFHMLKQLGYFSKDENTRFEKALVELQMKLYITMCGRARKTSQRGEEYGWSSTVFTTTERFFGSDVFEEARALTPEEAIKKVTAQVLKLNPEADTRKINKFIKG